MIRVLLVDDSPLAIAILKRMLSNSTEIEVAGTASNGEEALKLIPQLKPDVICTDFHMPVMDGLEFTKEVMLRQPLPILLVSVSGMEDSINAFKILEAGAIDIFLKPAAGDNEKSTSELTQKIRILSKVHVIRKTPHSALSVPAKPAVEIMSEISVPGTPLRIIVMGASTGGPEAFQTILTGLPSNYPLPIIGVQHISQGFLQGFVNWLSTQCSIKVEIAKAGSIPLPGTVYFPMEGTHLKIDSSGRFVSSTEPAFGGHRPSITITMQAVARYYGSSALGIIFTGMGKDGAEGLLEIRKAGGITIAQDEASSIIFGMPKQAIELNAAKYIVPLDDIGTVILNLTSKLSG